MELRGAEAEDILRDIAFKIINNMGLMQDIKIHCFPGGVTLTTTLTICGGKAFSETVAEASKRIMSKNTVRTAIKNLVSRGVIEREERFCDGRQTSCLYRIIGHNVYGRGSNIEGSGVQNLKGEGSKSDTQELEPRELEFKDLPPISPKSEQKGKIPKSETGEYSQEF